MDKINFNYNFDQLDLVKLFQEDRITKDEIIYVFETPRHIRDEGGPELSNTVFIAIAYTPKKRILIIAFTFPNETVNLIGAKVADENEIDNFYCGN